MIALLAVLLAAPPAAAPDRQPPEFRCREKSYVDKTGEWIGPCRIYASWWGYNTVSSGAPPAAGYNLKDWQRAIRVDDDGYVICSGTPQATVDLEERAKETARRRYQQLVDEMERLAP